MLAALLMLQAVAGPPAPRAAQPTTALPAAPCPPQTDDGDVVVCARKSDPPRLVKLPEEAPRDPQDMITFRLPGHATGNIHAFQHDLPGGVGQGAAFSVRIPFGKGKKD